MKIKNTINKELEVKIFGTMYSIGAGETITDIPREVAEYWRGLHEFLIISEDDPKKVVEDDKKDEEELKNDAKPKAPKAASKLIK